MGGSMQGAHLRGVDLVLGRPDGRRGKRSGGGGGSGDGSGDGVFGGREADAIGGRAVAGPEGGAGWVSQELHRVS